MIIYVESEIPQEEQKYQGWFWHRENKTFVRWSEFTGFNNSEIIWQQLIGKQLSLQI